MVVLSAILTFPKPQLEAGGLTPFSSLHLVQHNLVISIFN